MTLVKINIPDSFISDAAEMVHSNRVYDLIFDTIELLKTTPTLGSRNIPNSLTERYGDKVRKLVVSSFDVVYVYDPDRATIDIKALIHQRKVS